jgi:hypothetical protein
MWDDLVETVLDLVAIVVFIVAVIIAVGTVVQLVTGRRLNSPESIWPPSDTNTLSTPHPRPNDFAWYN